MLNRSAETLPGGHGALDFLNTVTDTGKSRDIDAIADAAMFRGWAERTGVISVRGRGHLAALSEAELGDIHRLRAAGYAVFSALAAGRPPPGNATDKLESRIRLALSRATLSILDTGTGWQPAEAPAPVADELALACEDLLRSPDLVRLTECERCTWLFLDFGRGRKRRWCDMRKCGNRAKAESFRKRRAGQE